LAVQRTAVPIQRSEFVDDIHEKRNIRVALTGFAETCGIGPLARGEVPHQLLSLRVKPLESKYPLLGSTADAAAVEARSVLRVDWNIKEAAAFAKEAAFEMEIRTHMAQTLATVLQNAGALLSKLQSANPLHRRTKDTAGNEVLVPVNDDLFDGIGMWKDYLVVLNKPQDVNDHDKHVNIIHEMRANSMPDNCSATQYVERMTDMQQKHNRYLGKAEIKGSDLSRFFIKQLPECHATERNGFLRDMAKHPDQLEDAAKVMEDCVLVIKIAHNPSIALPAIGSFVFTGRNTCAYIVKPPVQRRCVNSERALGQEGQVQGAGRQGQAHWQGRA